MINDKYMKPWKLGPQQRYVFRNANLIQSAEGTVRKNCTVVLSEGVIEAVEDTRNDTFSNDDAIVVDATGKYLCPGLIDAHLHISAVPYQTDLSKIFLDMDQPNSLLRQPYICKQILDRGFTTVRDCGGATLALKEAIADDVLPGPRLFFAGRSLTQSGGHSDMRGRHDRLPASSCCVGGVSGVSRICDGIPECIKGAREELRTGADFIKIMGGGGVASPTDKLENLQFTPEEIRAIVQCAENSDTYVTAHAYTPKAIKMAVDNGVRGIEHGNFIDEETAKLMAEKGVILTPTLIAYTAMASPEFPGFLPPESEAKNKLVINAGLQSLKIAADAGVTMCFGTDLIGPLTVCQSSEFSLRSNVLPPTSILQSATVNPARLLRREDFLGQIRPGFAADVLILNENPLQDIEILAAPKKHILAVIKDGRVYKSRWTRLRQDVPTEDNPIE